MKNPRTWTFIAVIVGLFILAQRLPLFKVALPVVRLPAENVHVFGLPIPNTMLATWIGMLIIVGLSYLAVSNMELVPKGVQNLIEWTIEAFYNLVESVVGEHAPRFFPLAMTIFLLVLVVNWMELVPGMDSIGLLERAHEGQTGYEVTQAGPLGLLTGTKVEREGFVVTPFVRTASTDLNLTFALALISVITCQYVGLKALGLGYIKKFFNTNGIWSLVGILEFISEIFKIIAFAFRLFGNLFAGQILLFVIPFLIPYLAPMPFYALEVFIGAIQAFIFAMLTLVFLKMATEAHVGVD